MNNAVSVSQWVGPTIKAGTKYWRPGADDITRVDDVDLIRLRGGDYEHSPFARLLTVVLKVPAAETKDFCLTSSLGVKTLITRRNEAYADEAKTAVMDNLQMAAWQRTRAKLSAKSIQAGRVAAMKASQLTDVEFIVNDVPHTIKVLRVRRDDGDLWIEYKPDLMVALLNSITQSGIAEADRQKRAYTKAAELPDGVVQYKSRKGDELRYRVKIPDEAIGKAESSGKQYKKSVTCSAIEDVHAALENPLKYAMGGATFKLANDEDGMQDCVMELKYKLMLKLTMLTQLLLLMGIL